MRIGQLPLFMERPPEDSALDVGRHLIQPAEQSFERSFIARRDPSDRLDAGTPFGGEIDRTMETLEVHP